MLGHDSDEFLLVDFPISIKVEFLYHCRPIYKKKKQVVSTHIFQFPESASPSPPLPPTQKGGARSADRKSVGHSQLGIRQSLVYLLRYPSQVAQPDFAVLVVVEELEGPFDLFDGVAG